MLIFFDSDTDSYVVNSGWIKIGGGCEVWADVDCFDAEYDVLVSY